MKKLVLFAVIVAAVAFSSCAKKAATEEVAAPATEVVAPEEVAPVEEAAPATEEAAPVEEAAPEAPAQ
ncbi:MAG: hypothetical protein LBI65_04790 [Candidatus Symbiothrix sp.]|jgi:outer membrane murein-binding lipoprotein Lpp|nr:hypothetical protein [Candidatus Symbiothrix sp.]